MKDEIKNDAHGQYRFAGAKRREASRVVRGGPILSLFAGAIACSALVGTTPATATQISSNIQLSNIQLSTGAGAIGWLSDWQVEASAGSFDTVFGSVSGGQSASGQPSSATANAVGAYSSASASVSVDSSGAPISVGAGSVVSYSPHVFDSAFANGVAFRDFEISGVSGLASVSVGFDYLAHLIGDQPGKGADFRGVLGITDGVTTYDLTAYEKHSGIMNLTFNGSLSQTLELQAGTPYSITLSVDPDNVPDCGPGLAMSAATLIGLFALQRCRNRQHASDSDNGSPFPNEVSSQPTV